MPISDIYIDPASVPTPSAGYTTLFRNLSGALMQKDPTGAVTAVGSGAAGNGIESTVITYQLSTSGTIQPSGEWLSDVPTLEPGLYLWTRTVLTYTDTTTAASYSVAYQGTNGTGTPGVGVASTAITYQSGSSGTAAPTGAWSSSVPTVANGAWLWTRTVLTYTDATTATSYSAAYQGTNGAAGTGVTVSSSTVTYQSASSGTTPPTGTWTTAVPAVAKGSYLWTRTVVTYSDTSTATSYSAAYQGIDGSPGSGVTVSSSAITYQSGTSGTTAPTGTWTTAVPAVAKGSYLWTRTIVTYSDTSTTTSYSSAYQGADGTAGSGVTVSSSVVSYQQSTVGTTAPTGTWTSTVPTPVPGQYIWTRTITTYSDSSAATSYSVAYQGTNGTASAPGTATIAQIQAWAENIFSYLSNASGPLAVANATATVTWPDGTSGVYTTTSIYTNTYGTSGVDAWTATYAGASFSGGTNRTITCPATTKDANGNPSNSPTITVA